LGGKSDRGGSTEHQKVRCRWVASGGGCSMKNMTRQCIVNDRGNFVGGQ